MFERSPDQFPITIGTTVGGGTVLDFRKYAGGRILITSGTPTSLTFYEALFGTPAADHKLCLDISALTCAVNQSVELPAALFASHSIVIVGNNAGAASLILKS